MPLETSRDNTAGALVASAKSLELLLERFESALRGHDGRSEKAKAKTAETSPDALDVIHDAAKLLKAHTTKLSLLMLNKPFTPSAIRGILEQIAATVAPAMMSAVETCREEIHTLTMRRLLIDRTTRAFVELGSMMKEVIAQASESGNAVTGSKGQLASTGVVWKACDELVLLKVHGITGAVTAKAQDLRELISDALDELKEWAENVEDEGLGDDEDVPSEDDDDNLSASDFGPTRNLPADREDLKRTVDTGVKKLKFVESLYKAVSKHRLARFEPSEKNTSRLNEVMALLGDIPSHTDDFAGGLYELDNDGALAQFQLIEGDCRKVIGLVSRSWRDEEDDFTAWSKKWLEMMDKLSVVS